MRKGHQSPIQLFRFDFFDFSFSNNFVGYDWMKAIIKPTISDLFKNHKTSNSFANSNNLFRFSCIKIFENLL